MSKKKSDEHHSDHDKVARITVDLRSRADRKAEGKALRLAVPLASHSVWKAPENRRDSIDLLIESSSGRVPELLPIRYGRMLQSPFTFYRGSAALMAYDLAGLPTTGINVQACGDAHLGNFRGIGTPERKIIFVINDLDETLPAPWEWDLKRLCTSLVVAGRINGYTQKEQRSSVLACVSSYRERMREFSKMNALDVWYFHIDADEFLEHIADGAAKRRVEKRIEKALDRSTLDDDFPEMVTFENGVHRIRDNPPLIYHVQSDDKAIEDAAVQTAFQLYRDSLADDRRVILDRYEFKDFARKVVGVGSVGTRCGIVLLMSGSEDPLFLQFKEARASVLEPYAGRSAYENHGQRVVMGQRLIQPVSDIFLGWAIGREKNHFYMRQLRDMKLKPQVEIFEPETMKIFGELAGWSLAASHARSGDSAKIAGYLGKKDEFDEAIADFSEAYADQNETDHQALVQAARNGRLQVHIES
ncbi:MAG: DUF2252 domain-containing protein [Methylococcales bacterium]|nr:DUF2252 domain-containing protein [Methylococcales bacterium]